MAVYRRVAVPAAAIRDRESAHRARHAFSRSEWIRLAWLYGAVAMLHVGGWGCYLYFCGRHPALVGLGFVAYMLGLRHAFDADHIAAVDDTVRYLQQDGRRPLGVGFYFSLGHSTIVFALALAIIFAATAMKRELPGLQSIGGAIGAGVSGTFLCLVGVLNLLVLIDLVKAWRRPAKAGHGHDHVEQLLAQRGFMNRLLGGRLRNVIRHSWQMYPLGLLFGLGFDTATEIGLLAMTAGASAANMPVLALLSLPLLFAAGMTVMDTTDGVLMSKAYDWAFVNPVRRMVYNVTITGLSVIVALAIGIVELLHLGIELLHLNGPWAERVDSLDFGLLGFIIVAAFAVTWAVAAIALKLTRDDEQPAPSLLHAHFHAHDDGHGHSHRHFH